MKYIIIADNLTDRWYYYECKNCLEEKHLFVAITLANPRRLTISLSPTISKKETMKEIQSVAELFKFVSKMAIESSNKMYVVAEHTEENQLFYYLADSKDEAVQVVTTLDLLPTKEWSFYYVDVIEDADIMLEAANLTVFLRLLNDCLYEKG